MFGRQKLGERQADKLQFLGLVDRQPALLELEDRIVRHVAVGEIRRPAVNHDGAGIGRMHSLDGEVPHLGGLQLEIDVVVLGAERRLAGVDDIDRERIGGARRHAATARSPPQGGQASRRSGERRIDVSGVGLERQCREPRGHLGRRPRPRLHEAWLSPSAALNAVAERAQRSMQACATSRWMVVNSNDSAGTGCVRPASASASKPSTSILMKRRHAVPRDQRIERRHRHAMVLVPVLALPAGRAVRGGDEGVRGGGDGRVGDVELELDGAGVAADRDLLDVDRAVAAVEQAQRRDQRGLRLDRDDARAKPAKRGNAVADMGADVEHQIAGRHEAA